MRTFRNKGGDHFHKENGVETVVKKGDIITTEVDLLKKFRGKFEEVMPLVPKVDNTRNRGITGPRSTLALGASYLFLKRPKRDDSPPASPLTRGWYPTCAYSHRRDALCCRAVRSHSWRSCSKPCFSLTED